MAVPETPAYLDALLADEPLTGGLEPMLGASHLRVMTVRGFPASTWPGLLDDLNRLGFPYRWTTRFLFLDKADGEKELSRLRRQWFAKRKGIVTLLRETVFQQESPLVDSDAANKAVDADEALQTLGSDQVAFGYVTATVVVWDEDARIAAERLKAVERVIQGRGFTTSPETLNAVEAWLSSIPGHVYANVRQPIVSTLNLAHLMPLSAVWAGPERNEHLGGPPLLITRTEGATPFRLTTHVGDVGHALVVGPTGAGKSVLLATLILQFRKYPESRIYVFDKGRSVRAAMLGLGGQFHDLGLEGGLTFQPLRAVDDPGARAWAAEWVQQLLGHERVEVTPEVKDAVWSALGSLGSAPVEERTLSGLATLLQSNKLRQALQPYTLDGPFGRLLDADHEDLTLGDLQAFEMEDLLHAKSVVLPVLTYLFHRLEAQFDGRPTLLVLDEAWVFLDDPVFASRIREWLKTLRKKNVGVVFATQSLADIQRSAIAPAIVESCPTRIFLPSPQAVEPQLRPIYEGFGLNARQIEMLARATPKRDYYVQSRLGNRLFDLGLGPVALAFVAASSPRDHALIDAALAALAGRLRRDLAQARGLAWAADLLTDFHLQGIKEPSHAMKRRVRRLAPRSRWRHGGALPAPAHAQWVVYDPSNFSQNVLTAARTLQQINNQIQSLQNEAQMILNQGQMLVNQGKNLASLAYSPMAMLQQDIARTNALIARRRGWPPRSASSTSSSASNTRPATAPTPRSTRPSPTRARAGTTRSRRSTRRSTCRRRSTPRSPPTRAR